MCNDMCPRHSVTVALPWTFCAPPVQPCVTPTLATGAHVLPILLLLSDGADVPSWTLHGIWNPGREPVPV